MITVGSPMYCHFCSWQGLNTAMEMEAAGEKSSKMQPQTGKICRALSYITGDMKALGEWLKGKHIADDAPMRTRMMQHCFWTWRPLLECLLIFKASPVPTAQSWEACCLPGDDGLQLSLSLTTGAQDTFPESKKNIIWRVPAGLDQWSILVQCCSLGGSIKP